MPGLFEEILGHDEAKEELRRLVVSGCVPPGILLLGEEGVGRRTLAKAFAKALLAADGTGSFVPGNVAARRFDAGKLPDFFCIDRDEGHRQHGIDRVRALKEAFSLTAIEGGRRVALIVDAERLTEEGSNSLLKVLEEPSPRCHIILTGRERGSVMETILSRCRTVRLRTLPRALVTEFLLRRGVDAVTARLHAELSEGRPALALEGTQLDAAATGLGNALLFAMGSTTPHTASEELLKALKDDTKNLEEARTKLRPIVKQALRILRAALARAHGAGTAGTLIDLLPEAERRHLSSIPASSIESRIGAHLRLLADIDRNVGLELLADTALTA